MRARGSAARRAGGAALVLAAPLGAQPAASAVVPSPPLAPDVAALPRLRGVAGTAARARLNAVLARADQKARTARRACLADARQADRRRGRERVGGDFQRSVAVEYESARYVSVTAVTGLYCGGAHPDDYTDAYTLDLAAGRALDWRRALRPGIVAATVEQSEAVMDSSALGRRYLAGLRRLPGRTAPADECLTELRTTSPFSYSFWLARDARGRPGLAVQPALAHVMAGCANDLPPDVMPLGVTVGVGGMKLR